MYNSSLLDDMRQLEAFLYMGPEPDMSKWERTNEFLRMQECRRLQKSLEKNSKKADVWYTLVYDPVAERVERVFNDAPSENK